MRRRFSSERKITERDRKYKRESARQSPLSPSTGATRWGRRYNGPNGGHDIPFGIAATADGSKVFVTGYSNRALANQDYATVAYEG